VKGEVRMKIIIVGFKVNEENSVYYKKLDYIMGEYSDDTRLLGTLKSALLKSDFISIRINKGEGGES